MLNDLGRESETQQGAHTPAAGSEEIGPLSDAEACRFCGRPVEPFEEPCKQCLAKRSPLVQLAIRLGAEPLCQCGGEVAVPGDICVECSTTAEEHGSTGMKKRIQRDDGLVLTVLQTAELLQVTENHVNNLCFQDYVEQFRAGNPIRRREMDANELRDLLRARLSSYD